MADYVARKINLDFEIDGDVGKDIWRAATWTASFVDMATGSEPDFLTRSAILWSQSHLYVAFYADEPNLQAQMTKRDSLIFLENDLELFIDGGDCYYELELNALNTVYEVFYIWRDSFPQGDRFPLDKFDIGGVGVYTFGGDYDRTGEHFWEGTHSRGTRWAFREFDMEGLRTAVHLDGSLNDSQTTDKGWAVELSIPWPSLVHLAGDRSLPPIDGDIWKMFLGRFDKKIVEGKVVTPHPSSALNSHGVYDTHQPEKWSEIIFRT